jgi:Amidase
MFSRLPRFALEVCLPSTASEIFVPYRRIGSTAPRSPEQLLGEHLRLKGLALKDNICTTQLPTSCASGILETYQSPYNATVVEELEALAVSVNGKTNMDEFGMGYELCS